MQPKLNVAIAHDWMVSRRGGERVLWAMHQAFPDAPIFTSVYNRAALPEFRSCDVRTSYLGRWPFAKIGHEFFPFLRSSVFESFDLSEYDVVISSSSAEAKGVLTAPETLQIAYIHTPTRYYWSAYQQYLAQPGFGRLSKVVRALMPLAVARGRQWDFVAAQRPDLIIANSINVAGRIEKFYRRSVDEVLYPPIDVERFSPDGTPSGGFLVVAKLTPYKRVDLAVEACRRLKRPLTVVGSGSELSRLRRMAGPETTFVGNVSDETLAQLYRQAQALLFPGEEDFGMAPLEAMASGRPVIAFGRGGALESVVDGKTGVLFEEQTVEALLDAIARFDGCEFASDALRSHAEGFSADRFIAALRDFVHREYERFNRPPGL